MNTLADNIKRLRECYDSALPQTKPIFVEHIQTINQLVELVDEMRFWISAADPDFLKYHIEKMPPSANREAFLASLEKLKKATTKADALLTELGK